MFTEFRYTPQTKRQRLAQGYLLGGWLLLGLWLLPAHLVQGHLTYGSSAGLAISWLWTLPGLVSAVGVLGGMSRHLPLGWQRVLRSLLSFKQTYNSEIALRERLWGIGYSLGLCLETLYLYQANYLAGWGLSLSWFILGSITLLSVLWYSYTPRLWGRTTLRLRDVLSYWVLGQLLYSSLYQSFLIMSPIRISQVQAISLGLGGCLLVGLGSWVHHGFLKKTLPISLRMRHPFWSRSKWQKPLKAPQGPKAPIQNKTQKGSIKGIRSKNVPVTRANISKGSKASQNQKASRKDLDAIQDIKSWQSQSKTGPSLRLRGLACGYWPLLGFGCLQPWTQHLNLGDYGLVWGILGLLACLGSTIRHYAPKALDQALVQQNRLEGRPNGAGIKTLLWKQMFAISLLSFLYLSLWLYFSGYLVKTAGLPFNGPLLVGCLGGFMTLGAHNRQTYKAKVALGTPLTLAPMPEQCLAPESLETLLRLHPDQIDTTTWRPTATERRSSPDRPDPSLEAIHPHKSPLERNSNHDQTP